MPNDFGRLESSETIERFDVEIQSSECQLARKALKDVEKM